MGKLLSTGLLLAVTVLIGYITWKLGAVSDSSTSWTFLTKTVTPAEAGDAQPWFVVLTGVCVVGLVVGGLLDRREARTR